MRFFCKTRLQNIKTWFGEPKNAIGTVISLAVFAALVIFAVWVNQPQEGETAQAQANLNMKKPLLRCCLKTMSKRITMMRRGRRVGTQELEIRILAGKHKDEIMSLTNNMSTLFNVDLGAGDKAIVRVMTDEDGSYYASLYNYNRGIVLAVFVLMFFLVIVILGGKKGFGALIGLLFTLGPYGTYLFRALYAATRQYPLRLQQLRLQRQDLRRKPSVRYSAV